ncbi:MAG: hypothetical protein JNM36_00220 [Chitinophagales bacterium]|jgi:hypothetical protein|nr:hypothetical protein [Chitinophagales bacterium]
MMILSALSLGQSNPFRQASIIGLIGVLVLVSATYWSSDPAKPWFLAGVFLGFYTWLNAVVGFFKRHSWLRYVGQSLVGFALLAGCLYGAAYWSAATPLRKVPQYFTVFMATVVFEILAQFVVGIMRGIAQWAGTEHFMD